jgi:hypothetical protein
LTSLVKKFDQRLESVAGKTPRPPGVFVIVNNADGLDGRLRTLAEKEKLKRVSLCIGAAPRDYEVSNEAEVTVVIYRIGKRRGESVTANFALRKGELTGCKIDAIVKELSAVLPK